MGKKNSTVTVVVVTIVCVLALGATGLVLWLQGKDNEPVETSQVETNKTETSKSTSVKATELDTTGLRDFVNNKTTGYVYIGRPTCPHCAIFTPILNEVTSDRGHDDIYYYNTDAARTVSADDLSAMMTQLNVEGVPTFIYFRDGVEVDRLGDTESKQALLDFFAKNQ